MCILELIAITCYTFITRQRQRTKEWRGKRKGKKKRNRRILLTFSFLAGPYIYFTCFLMDVVQPVCTNLRYSSMECKGTYPELQSAIRLLVYVNWAWNFVAWHPMLLPPTPLVDCCHRLTDWRTVYLKTNPLARKRGRERNVCGIFVFDDNEQRKKERKKGRGKLDLEPKLQTNRWYNFWQSRAYSLCTFTFLAKNIFTREPISYKRASLKKIIALPEHNNNIFWDGLNCNLNFCVCICRYEWTNQLVRPCTVFVSVVSHMIISCTTSSAFSTTS